MRRTLQLSALLLSTLVWGGASASVPLSAIPGPAAADPLDPSLAARSACRGAGQQRAVLEQRLAWAQALSQAAGAGQGGMGLYSGIAQSDLLLGSIDPVARRYFDQGLALAYGFNHKAAIRSFQQARAIDPACAMCWWGEAFANGPNINAGMDSAQNRAALAALARARELAGDADPQAKALIAAQAARYSADPQADRAALDRAYARAMLALSRQHPASDDLAILAAEAAMNTSPWNYWEGEDNQPRPLIAEAVSLIETVMARNPAHPQASHLYIHLLELPDPRRAEAAADRLRTAAPGALGHLVHMPAHIYHRVGRYADSIEANARAVAADEAYLREAGDDGLVRYGYYPHNVHFLLTSAQMMGDVGTVVTQTARLESILDVEVGRELYWIQAIYAAPYFAHAQYGSPEAILALTQRPHPLAYVDAMRHYARAVAYAQTRDEAGFADALANMERLAGNASIGTMEGGGFPAGAIIALATEVAKGRQAMAAGRHDAAIGHFSRAAGLQKTIPYSEPAYWYYPVTQSLGAAYLAAGRNRDALNAFRAALFETPNNALALYGLRQAERRLGNAREAAAADKAFKAVWRGDDRWLDMSRL